MPLVVETGAGLLDADAYCDVQFVRDYHASRGNDITAMTDTQVEQAIRRATTFIDTEWRFKAYPLNQLQSLEFPRTGLEWNGRVIVGVPLRVKQACAELAVISRNGPLRVDQDRGGKVVSESVGPISVTYAEDAPAGKLYSDAMALLKPYTRASMEPPAPFFVQPAMESVFGKDEGAYYGRSDGQ